MSFNHRFPEIPALDTAALVTLMRDPQKAAELWDKYTKARAEYDGLRASIAAENAKLNERLVVVEAGEKTLANDKLVFDSQVAEFKSKSVVAEQSRKAAADSLAARESGLASREAAMAAKETTFKATVKKWDEQVAGDNAKLAAIEATLLEKNEAVAAREAAVAKREETATKLAALLKGV
jgi:hypothetical protein